VLHADDLPCRPQTQGEAGKMRMTRYHALRAGFTTEGVFKRTNIDRWFLVQIKEIVDFEEELAGAKN
jgi:hypothetical protein